MQELSQDEESIFEANKLGSLWADNLLELLDDARHRSHVETVDQ